MSETSQLAIRPKASQQLASLIGMEPSAMLDTIKAQCFKTNPANVTNEQLAAFVSIAAEMQVNPLLPGMLYAFPIQGGGIVPIMGPDGVYKKLTEHPDIDSWETTVFPEDVSLPPTHATTKIWRKGRERPIAYTALLSEWRINSNPNWNTRPRHFLALRSLKHAARQIIHGLPYDEDDRAIMGEINVTPQNGTETQTEAPVKRADAPARRQKGVSAAQQQTKQEEHGTMEAEIVPEKKADETTVTAEKINELSKEAADKQKEKAHQIAADIAAEKKQDAPAPKQETPKAPTKRDSLADKEEIVAVCKLEKVFAFSMKVAGTPTPSVQATVSGEFSGDVFDLGGGVVKDDTIVAGPLWKTGETVKLTLRGRINNLSKKVMPIAMKIEAVEATAESQQMEVE